MQDPLPRALVYRSTNKGLPVGKSGCVGWG